MSPSESDRTLFNRVVSYLRERILEPLLTAKRFVYLCFVFIPVFLTAPMLLVGQPESKFGGDKWGAVWWYGFLTRQMQQAGPTSIKVSLLKSDCYGAVPSFRKHTDLACLLGLRLELAFL